MASVSPSDIRRELWPWLMDGTTPAVEALSAGTAAELRARVAEFAGPGEVLVVVSVNYRLVLLAYEGHVLVG